MKTNSQPQASQRAASRKPTEAFITCKPYASSGGIPATDGIMRNFSTGGSYIETAEPFKSGTILFMRMVRYPPALPPAASDDHPRSICLAEVKWQQTLAEADAVRYGMGVRYLD